MALSKAAWVVLHVFISEVKHKYYNDKDSYVYNSLNRLRVSRGEAELRACASRTSLLQPCSREELIYLKELFRALCRFCFLCWKWSETALPDDASKKFRRAKAECWGGSWAAPWEAAATSQQKHPLSNPFLRKVTPQLFFFLLKRQVTSSTEAHTRVSRSAQLTGEAHRE